MYRFIILFFIVFSLYHQELCAILTQINIHVVQYSHSHVLQQQIISCILFYRVILNITFFFTFCFPPNYSHDQIFVEKYKIKHVLFMPEVSQKSHKYTFRYLTKHVKSNMSGYFWPYLF